MFSLNTKSKSYFNLLKVNTFVKKKSLKIKWLPWTIHKIIKMKVCLKIQCTPHFVSYWMLQRSVLFIISYIHWEGKRCACNIEEKIFFLVQLENVFSLIWILAVSGCENVYILIARKISLKADKALLPSKYFFFN